MINLHEYLDYYHILSIYWSKILEHDITHAIFFDTTFSYHTLIMTCVNEYKP